MAARRLVLHGREPGGGTSGVIQSPQQWDLVFLAHMMGIMGLGYVMGFVIIIVPSGLGVHKFFLTLLLWLADAGASRRKPDDAAAQAVLAVLLLRLSWTVAELIVAGVLYWLPHAPPVQQMAETPPAALPPTES